MKKEMLSMAVRSIMRPSLIATLTGSVFTVTVFFYVL